MYIHQYKIIIIDLNYQQSWPSLHEYELTFLNENNLKFKGLNLLNEW